MPKGNDSIVRIGPYNIGTAQTSPVICNHFTSAHILVVELPKGVIDAKRNCLDINWSFNAFPCSCQHRSDQAHKRKHLQSLGRLCTKDRLTDKHLSKSMLLNCCDADRHTVLYSKEI
jgi:hypothetical protein